jgi:hypothetical protein
MPDSDTTQGTFGDIVIDLKLAVVEKLGERYPPLGAVCNSGCHHRLRREAMVRIIENGAKFCDQRLGSFLTGFLPDTGWLPAHFGFNGIEGCDPLKDVRGERGWLGLVNIKYFAPEMGPARHFGDAPALVELVISGISIGLKMALETGEFLLRMYAGAVRGEPVLGQRRRGGT